jgi:hypothetical protein
VTISMEQLLTELNRLIDGTRRPPSRSTQVGKRKIEEIFKIMCRAQNISHLRAVVDSFVAGRGATDFPLPADFNGALFSSRDPSLGQPKCEYCGGIGFLTKEVNGFAAAERCPRCQVSGGPASESPPVPPFRSGDLKQADLKFDSQ